MQLKYHHEKSEFICMQKKLCRLQTVYFASLVLALVSGYLVAR